MSYVNLDLDALCSEANPSSVHFAMREWEKAESPSVYWYRKFRKHYLMRSMQEIRLDHYISKDNMVSLVHGLPVKEALTMCKKLYKNSIAKVTIQISKEVLMTSRDFSVTFAEQLSIISMYYRVGLIAASNLNIFRWNNRTVHRIELNEHCRGILLDL